MLDDWNSKTAMYATKRRRRSVKSVKTPMKDPPKSNPSKRHRERLNSELDHLASLLPFEQSVISKLDRLSILRLAVSYLRTKSYFQAALHERYALEGHHHLGHGHIYGEPSYTDTDSVLQALNGFLFVVSCDGEVFFSSRTVEQYLGFHQSDIIHQSALELIHSEDREDFKNQLNWRSQFPQDQADISLQEALLPENSHLLQRSFTVRFRCLLDNTSGFITLEINGRIKILHGQSLKGPSPAGEEPPLALFAICCPFGPLPMLDVPPRDYTFKSKHKMDLAPVSMDHRGKLLFGYSDHELQEKGGYDLIHPDDLRYYADAHHELIKTGSSGLIAYRLMTKDWRWLWLQTSSKVVYKNSKPDFVICTHRHLTDDEGRDLVGKRGTEFKLPYPIIDTDTSGLGSPLDDEMTKLKSPRGKKSKNQLRDYLNTSRKRNKHYRDPFNLNGYTAYPTLNGYPNCQPAPEVKPDIMYPYSGNNYGLETDLYRTGYPAFASTMYPAAADTFRLEADKHSYTNGYYLEPRQYQHTLQYHGSPGYSDFMSSAGTKYSYDMTKYGYDHMSSYGLDLSKRAPFDDVELTKYETDFRKYSHDYGPKMNGALDPMRTSSLYGTTPLLNQDSLISCNMSHTTASPCSLYRTDPVSTGSSMDRYAQDVGLMSKDTKAMKLSTDQLHDTTDNKSQIPNGHASVIRNASPRTKSPRNERPICTSSSIYSNEASVLTSCSNTTWPTCNKTNGQSSTSPHSEQASSQPLLSHVTSEMSSRIMSPTGHKHHEVVPVALNTLASHSNSSPASATTATSVIQQSGRARSCEKQHEITGSIAVPVVKSSSWLHHIPTPSYDWHGTSADSYSSYQRSLRGTDVYGTSADMGHRSVIESSKGYVMAKVGDRKDEESNPLLSFSEVTHTLLNGE